VAANPALSVAILTGSGDLLDPLGRRAPEVLRDPASPQNSTMRKKISKPLLDEIEVS
jgi:hypothetical protein